MKTILQLCVVSALFAGAGACGAGSSEKPAKHSRADAADSEARVANPVKTSTANEFVAGRARLTIPKGTLLKVSLGSPLDTGTSLAGQRFWASLSEPVVIDGKTILEQGTQLRGRVVGVEGSGRGNGLAGMQLALTDIVHGYSMLAITTAAYAATAEEGKEIHYGAATSLDFTLADSVHM